MIDAILDEELEVVLGKLPLAAEIKEPLLTRKGAMAAIIKLVEFIEHAQWDKTNIVMEKLKLDKEQAVKHYNEALAWADEQSMLAG
jgi:EAL and modified HD-GYP domain-containing signal transduction protein